MKYLSLSILAIGLFLASCGSGGNDSAAKQQARESIQDRVADPAPLPSSTGVASTGTVQHYTCPNNCDGSGGPAQANCPVCGTAYVHNQAFHNQSGATPNPTTPTTPTPSPATNAAGVYHYICNQGCAGGAGAAGNCASCGNPLQHNDAYHS